MFDNENKWYQTNSRRQQRFLGCIAGLQIPPSSHPIGAVAGCRLLQFPSICSFCQKILPSGHSRLTEILKGCVILKSGPQMLNRNSSTKSFPALTSLPRFLLSLCFISTKLSTLAARVQIFTYNLSTSDTNKHVYLKFCYMLKANIILLAKKLLNQEVIQATEIYSKLREISLNYFLPTYCIENASTFKALCQLAALSPPSSR